MLVYILVLMEDDLEIIGFVIVKVYVSIDGWDMDFIVKLVDVYLDGYLVNLCDGIVCGCYWKLMLM